MIRMVAVECYEGDGVFTESIATIDRVVGDRFCYPKEWLDTRSVQLVVFLE